MANSDAASSVRNHLSRDYTEPVRDPLWRHIYLSPGLKRLMSTPAFRKLGRIKQLGPAHLVYPGATHTRLNHSLGVFYLAKRIVEALVLIPDTAELFTPVGVKSFLTAALLHDLGHFPFAHSLKELPLDEHEHLTARVMLDEELASIIRKDVGADPDFAARIVDLSLDAQEDPEVHVYRRILSGALDPDKLDYLSRDAYFCGVTYGAQDIDFVIHKLRFRKGVGLLIEDQGLPAVENILFSKYLMYKSVYWHKTVRIATAMIKKAVYQAMVQGQLKPRDLYGLDDEEFFRIFSGNSSDAGQLVDAVFKRRLHKLVVELPFRPEDRSHTELLNLDRRAQMEARVAHELGAVTGTTLPQSAVVVDIPEPISFEIDLDIEVGDASVPFSKSGTVFGPTVVSGFSRALRKLRVFVSPEYVGTVPNLSWWQRWAERNHLSMPNAMNRS